MERRHADYVTGVVAAERERVTIQEAARRLGVSESAIRKRVQRGTLQHQKGGDGRVYVYLDMGETGEDTVRDTSRDELVDELRDTVRDLRERLDREEEANRENRRLLAAALERIPAIEAPQEPRGEPETGRQDAGGVDRGEAVEAQAGAEEPPTNVERSTEESARRPSWWRRIFGG